MANIFKSIFSDSALDPYTSVQKELAEETAHVSKAAAEQREQELYKKMMDAIDARQMYAVSAPDMAAHIHNIGVLSAPRPPVPPPFTPTAKGPRWDDYEKLAMRMGWELGQPFDSLHIARKKSDNTVVLFIMSNSQPVTLEDDAALFPSDSLISRLKLLG